MQSVCLFVPTVDHLQWSFKTTRLFGTGIKETRSFSCHEEKPHECTKNIFEVLLGPFLRVKSSGRCSPV